MYLVFVIKTKAVIMKYVIPCGLFPRDVAQYVPRVSVCCCVSTLLERPAMAGTQGGRRDTSRGATMSGSENVWIVCLLSEAHEAHLSLPVLMGPQ